MKASFEQNQKALSKLLETGNAELTHTQDRGKWGKLFPKLLMEVRAELGGEPFVKQKVSKPVKVIPNQLDLFSQDINDKLDEFDNGCKNNK